VAENEDCRAEALAKADGFQLAIISQRATTRQANQIWLALSTFTFCKVNG